ncbi:MAG: enoyl-CoA hydratase/isomerase family protein [Actinomycetota bacterium]
MIEIENIGVVAVVRIRYGKVNALDAEVLRAITDAVREVEASPARAMVVTGAGRVFSAGADLIRVLAEGKSYVEESLPILSEAFTTLFRFPRPAVAAINGHAIAGGAIIAFACDHRVMARGDATFGVAELRVGVAYPVAGLEIVRYAVGAKGLQELVYFGQNYGADEALRRGLVDELAEDDTVLGVALERAERLARIPTESFSAAKSILRSATLEAIKREAPARDPDVVRLWSSDEVRASIREFLESLAKR